MDHPRLRSDTGVEGRVRDGPARVSSLLASRDVSARRDVPVRTRRVSSRPNPSELGVNFVRGKLSIVRADEGCATAENPLVSAGRAGAATAQLADG